MNTQIEQLKTELRELIELSNAATKGPWQSTQNGVDQNNSLVANCVHYRCDEDAAFIARSRNISPALAECLLVAVEALESLMSRIPVMGSTGDYQQGQLDGIGAMAEQARVQLQEILTIWEAAK